jgi:hypothetical protein
VSTAHRGVISFGNFHLFFRQVHSKSERFESSKLFLLTTSHIRNFIIRIKFYCWCLIRTFQGKTYIGRYVITLWVHFKECREWLLLSASICRIILLSLWGQEVAHGWHLHLEWLLRLLHAIYKLARHTFVCCWLLRGLRHIGINHNGDRTQWIRITWRWETDGEIVSILC